MKRPKETTYQVVLDALALTTCYSAFLITADVPVIYMHQFWDTVYKHGSSYRFKINNKKFAVNVKEFREILNICPRIHGQSFVDPPCKEEALSFVRYLGHTGEIKHLTDITVDHLHQPWRAFAAIINKFLSGKIDNKDAKKSNNLYYPRFTKANISHYIKKNPSISMRNWTFMHTARDDAILGIMKFVSKLEDVQFYGALMPKEMMNPEMLSSESFQTYYAIATGAEPPKSKKQRKADSSKSSEETPTRKSSRIKKVALSEEAQLKEVIQKSKKDFHISHTGGSGASTDEGTEDDEDKDASDDNDDENDDEGDDKDDSDDTDGDNNDEDEGDDKINDDVREEEEEENIDVRVHTPEDSEFSDQEDDEEKNEEEEDDYEMLYRDVNVNLRAKDNKGHTQSSSVSSDFTNKLLNLENVSPTEYTMAFVMDTTPLQTPSLVNTTTPLPPPIIPPPHQATPTTTKPITPALTIPEQTQSAFDLPIFASILPTKIHDFATPLIEITVAESHDRVVLAKSSSQPKSTYEAATSLTEFDLKKILLDKMQDSKSYRAAQAHKDLYDSLAKSYKLDKDLFDTYGKAYSLKRDREDKDKDEDPSTGSDRGSKRRKTGKEA
ncbi:hypothetical protein Tco_1564025 [Tanacetum coccineum]